MFDPDYIIIGASLSLGFIMGCKVISKIGSAHMNLHGAVIIFAVTMSIALIPVMAVDSFQKKYGSVNWKDKVNHLIYTDKQIEINQLKDELNYNENYVKVNGHKKDYDDAIKFQRNKLKQLGSEP